MPRSVFGPEFMFRKPLKAYHARVRVWRGSKPVDRRKPNKPDWLYKDTSIRHEHFRNEPADR